MHRMVLLMGQGCKSYQGYVILIVFHALKGIAFVSYYESMITCMFYQNINVCPLT